MLLFPMFTLSLGGFPSQSSQSPSLSPGLSLFRSSLTRLRSAAALAPQLFPGSCTDGSPDERPSSVRPFLHRPFVACPCPLTEQNESKIRPLFSYSCKRKNLQLLCCYIFTKTGGFELPFSSEKEFVTSRLLYFATSASSHGTNAPLPRLHRCRGELHAQIYDVAGSGNLDDGNSDDARLAQCSR